MTDPYGRNMPCPSAACGCNGAYIDMTTTNPPINYNTDFSDVICSDHISTSNPYPWWKVTFTSTTSIKTVGIINSDFVDFKAKRMIATVGNNANPKLNPTCINEYTMTDGGFYMCSTIM